MRSEYQSILSVGVEKKYRTLEQEIMSDVVRRIQKAGKITSTADWQLQRYMVLGHSTEDVENIIRSAVGGDYVDTFRLYDEVIETEYVRSKAMYEQVNAYFVPYEENYELQQLTSALIQQSNDELFNISKSLGFMVDAGNGRKVFTPLSEIYNGYLDNAITMMASGAYDYNTLIRKVVGHMTASGLRTVDYASGHSNRVDVAVRRALLTGMGQLTGRISDMNAQRLGTDQFEIDWHPGARPDHAVWQGRVWRKEQLYSVCGLGTGPGLLGWNCRHTYYPFIPGVSVRNYSDEWLEAKAREEAEKKPFRGKEYNTYEAAQKQRQMETAMRAQRQKAVLLKEGKADPDDILNARCKYQAMLDEYKEFSRKFHLPEQRERIYADLHGRVAPSQRTYKQWQGEQADKAMKRKAAKERKADRAQRERAEKNRRVDMDKAAKSGIMKLEDTRTPDDVLKLMKSKDWFIKKPMPDGSIFDSGSAASLDGTDLACARAIYKAHESVFAKWPQLIGKFSSVTTGDLDRTVYAQCHWGFGSGGTCVNKKLFNDSVRLAAHYEKDVLHNFHPAGTDWTAIEIHELGHALDDYLSNALRLAGMKNSYQAKAVSAELRPRVMRACGLKVSDAGNAVSKYAEKNAKEWFAECFAEYMASENPRSVAKEFGRQLEIIMKGVK